MNQQSLSSLIWSVADLLRGDLKQSEYGRVILPFTVLRRLDCVLAPTKEAALNEHAAKQTASIAFEPFVKRKTGLDFYNVSSLDMGKLMGDQDNIRANLDSYIQGFAPDVRSIFEHFDFAATVERLHKAKLLYLVTEKFAAIKLHPSEVDNVQMGLVFEELIRKFAELSNETAGEHFTPREVIRLMVNLLFIEDNDALTKPGVVRTMYDPTAGTGGMLSVAGEYLFELNPKARLTLYGQELNPESHAICKADMLIRGQDISNIVLGNTLGDDGLLGKLFDYMLSNPPFGVEWKKIEKAIREEYEKQGYNGRFGPGLPRVSDGSLLFLLHLLSKMRPAAQGGSRIGIVLNGSPLFTGGAGSGESEIRRHVLENDLVEAIVALPTDMFYNTGISTYVWVLSNRKPDDRKGFVQLIDGSSFWQKMRKSLGSKRKEMSDEHIATVTKLFGDFMEASLVTVLDDRGKETGNQVQVDGETLPKAPAGGKVKRVPISRIFRNEEFGYRTITVERPLRDENGKPMLGERGKLRGKLQPDSSQRDTENVPLSEDVEVYFKREVLPHAPDAWMDQEKTKVGYEIPFNRHFYVFEPPRELAEIDADLKKVTDRIKAMIEGLSA
ncbi:MAG: SAM-dependent DNA methyltransferase [Methylibium sp.]|uniref:type I restriction-modification system subunit M n=1 Tax=Methylibium sp. TaxID=2067992 RepID=UPI0017E1A0BB|nr:class I SAM-dependent DNA methyltransferase [Methylibium sp.]MBA3596217.1 SAM-dependent DNA methyltransferase [Methylibium sp.]